MPKEKKRSSYRFRQAYRIEKNAAAAAATPVAPPPLAPPPPPPQSHRRRRHPSLQFSFGKIVSSYNLFWLDFVPPPPPGRAPWPPPPTTLIASRGSNLVASRGYTLVAMKPLQIGVVFSSGQTPASHNPI